MAQSHTTEHQEQRQVPRQQEQPTQATPPGDPMPSQADADAILEGTYGLSKDEREKREREKKERDMKAGEGGAYQTR